MSQDKIIPPQLFKNTGEKPTPENQFEVLKKDCRLPPEHLKKVLEIFFSNTIPRYRKDKNICPRCKGHRHVGLDNSGDVYPCVTCLNIHGLQAEWYAHAAKFSELEFYAKNGVKKGFIQDGDLISNTPEDKINQ